MNKTLKASPSNSHPLFKKSGAKTLTLKSNKVSGVWKPQGFELHALVVEFSTFSLGEWFNLYRNSIPKMV